MKHLLCTCILAAGAASAHGQLSRVVYANGIDRPVFMTHAGDDSNRMFVIEQEGAIRIIDAGGNLLPAPFIDIDAIVVGGNSGGDERGLLGLAFHPDYANNGKFYVNYTGSGTATRIAEYQVLAGDPDIANPATARILMTIGQPFSNHNGGWMGFGPDGFLYIATGDGGSGNDPGNRAANLGQLLGKILRIDVDTQDAGLEYGIPAGNPWADDGDPGTRAEIWHYGLRNPWRTSFDSETGDMWIGDVGQNAREEVNHDIGNVGGKNYGWRCREGFQATGMACTAPDPWTDPVHDYPLSGGNCSVIGGFVYRGCELGEAYQGKYFFGDYCAGTIWTLDPDNGYALSTEFDFGFGLSSWGTDESGELYMANLFGGTVYKMVNTSAPDVDENGIPDACESSCLPDMNGDETLDFFDISAFLTAFSAGDLSADFTGDGALDFFDISAFLTAFATGCP
ncbi:MAG: PQQ-dependent sugar dehydrogenase [Phycisphaerales bacterium]|nr:PQQ-dependent sugar dehydrogenase [Phycisphaerales bacterium]